jgi:diguanylate cyclase (GGDEF)-like protein
LLIEDEPSDADLVHDLLDDGDYDIRHAVRLGEALDVVARESFDLIVADLQLPDAWGLDAIARLQRAVWQTPIVVMTGHDDPARAAEALRSGVQDYIIKGTTTAADLDRRLRYAIERGHSLTRLVLEAHHDPLTGLATRQAFLQHAEHAIGRAVRKSTPVTVLYLDLDGFKTINDEHGHNAGDSVLREVGKRLRRIARSHDLVARMGGDEFTVLLEDVDTPEAAAIAQRIIDALSRPLALGDRTLTITPSIGLALVPPEGCSVQTLVHAADQAMFQSKTRGTGLLSLPPVAG